ANSIVPANAVGVQYNYYEDYFYSQGTCISRGRAMTQPGSHWIGFQCVKHSGDTKWSMHLFWDDGLGCRTLPSTESASPESFVVPACG
ncbi:hypothetical protein, partial [Brooklawnia sp.]|uniref:hypothetical protein n=1 Tax=Brooklawnia sp. TaxID=2699740 RepID=UPI00311F4C0B